MIGLWAEQLINVEFQNVIRIDVPIEQLVYTTEALLREKIIMKENHHSTRTDF